MKRPAIAVLTLGLALVVSLPAPADTSSRDLDSVDPIDYQILTDLFYWELNPELAERRRQQLRTTAGGALSGRLVLAFRFPGSHPESTLRPYTERAASFAVAHRTLVDDDGTYATRDAKRYRKALSRANRKLKKRLRRTGHLDEDAGRFPSIGVASAALEPLIVRRLGRGSPVAMLLRHVGPRESAIPFVPEPLRVTSAEEDFVVRVLGVQDRHPHLPFAYSASGLLLCGNEAFANAHLRLMEDPSYRLLFETSVREYELQAGTPPRPRRTVESAHYTLGLHERLDAVGIGDRLKQEVLRSDAGGTSSEPRER